MAEMVGRLKKTESYWSPPVESVGKPAQRRADLCDECGTEYIIGSRFCYACGQERTGPGIRHSRTAWLRHLRLNALSARFGLAPGVLVAFAIGLTCLVCAAGIGLIYSATTVLDWQAIQVWRLEWLLAATAMFLAAILLKKPAA